MAIPSRNGDFTRVNRRNATPSQPNTQQTEIAFYKMLMTLANMHSTIYSFYMAAGQDSLGAFHRDLSARFVNEANRIKNINLFINQDD